MAVWKTWKPAAVGVALLAAVSVERVWGAADEKAAASEKVFELRTYLTHEGKLDALNKRFRDHTIKLFEKHGMENVGYWVPADGEKSKNTLIYVLAHKSPTAAKKSWAGFREDEAWKKAFNESHKDGPIVKKVESVYMKAVDYSKIK